MLLEAKGVKRGKGGDRKSTAKVEVDTVKEVAEELGVPVSTAEKRLRQADQYESLPKKEQRAVAKEAAFGVGGAHGC